MQVVLFSILARYLDGSFTRARTNTLFSISHLQVYICTYIHNL